MTNTAAPNAPPPKDPHAGRWDRLRIPYPGLGSVRVAQPTDFDTIRMVGLRVPPFQAVVSSPDAASTERALSEAKAEYDRRQEFWRRTWGYGKGARRRRIGSYVLVVVAAYFVVPLMPRFLAFLLFCAFVYSVFRVAQNTSRGRLLRCVERRVCPDCGYDLAHTSLVLNGVDCSCVGPKVCQECGAAWPLVPPAIEGTPAPASI